MAMRNAVVGIGQELLGDDAAGLAVCRRLKQLLDGRSACDGPSRQNGSRAEILILAAGSAPENCTGRLRRFRPDWIILVDAARMGADPGAVRWIPWEAAEAIGGSTHTLPLRLLSEYLIANLGCRISLLGIQPADSTLGAPLSAPVAEAVDSVARGLVTLLAGGDSTTLAAGAEATNRSTPLTGAGPSNPSFRLSGTAARGAPRTSPGRTAQLCTTIGAAMQEIA